MVTPEKENINYMTTNQYSIAILLPTRGRTAALSRSVISLFNRAVNPKSIQLLLAFDNDDDIGRDHFTNELEPWLIEKDIAYMAMEFEPVGYIRLNEYFNALAINADADWLMTWNDDAIMDSSGWDRVITAHTGQFKLLALHTHNDHPYSIFPIIPKAWIDVTKHYSPHQMIDAWVSQQAYMLDIFKRIDVWATHDRHDLTGNNTDSTFKARVALEGHLDTPGDFHHMATVNLRMIETETIANYMKSVGLDTTFWENVLLGEQYPWARLVENDTNKQMAQFVVDTPLSTMHPLLAGTVKYKL